VSQAFADEIGADGYAKDSTLAVVKAKSLLGVAVTR
jgi:methanogenic corrinoid protein MtbC1